MSHLYKVGQVLDLSSSPRVSNRPSGPCEVVTCLPHENGPVLYRVKSRAETNERVVEENDLTPTTTVQGETAALERAFSISIRKG